MNLKSLAALMFTNIAMCATAHAQDSTMRARIGEVLITATRSEQLLGDVPMPVSIVSKKIINQSSSMRLSDVLAELPGLTLVQNLGTGVQMQGFDPDYTLILLDGEPMIGRQGGTLDLNRLAVGNIQKIEIVKGPSSSLYGSDALAGVINIITEETSNTKASASGRYGTNNTSDFNVLLQLKHNKIGVDYFIDRFKTDGFTQNMEGLQNSISPFNNTTHQAKVVYRPNLKTKFSVNGRVFTESQYDAYEIPGPQTRLISGNGQVQDINIQPIATLRLNDNIRLQMKYYFSKYNSAYNYQDQDGTPFDSSRFGQMFSRPEMVWNINHGKNASIVTGAGLILEKVESDRYTGLKDNQTWYGFAQYSYKPAVRWNIIAGIRYDLPNKYASQWSPKLAVAHHITEKITIKTSAGIGYKTPDFRQLYLNFNNNTVGYSVFGTNEIALAIAELQSQGLINELFSPLSRFNNLRAERSFSINLGANFKLTPNLELNVNAFNNNVKDLIETVIVAAKTNNTLIYSYDNLNAIFTRGFELDARYSVSQNLVLYSGYQWLQTGDVGVLKQINDGQIFARDPVTLETTQVSRASYGGLFNRSKHMANIRVFYTVPHWFTGSVRVIYRGKYGFGDLNSNSILDAKSEYVKGYFLTNINFTKNFKNILEFQTGIDNLFDFKNPVQIPAIYGRLFFIKLNVFIQNKNEN